ncbi:flagellar basal body rod C-terminal domain-containing protein [Sulfurimonas sp.]|uniref:flagellar basal body rod C-terminal domain-containing protein n=1 Tax=Sulfurimonas sp. TaxID=2022749 RepID=UPI0025E34FA3|nr:flagellar basal body rod C-terminal domain-containing protein [Sulfurimonas sp.]
MNISNNMSSIQSNQTMMNASASNIVNNKADLSKEMPNQIVAQHATTANVNTIKAQDEMLGSMLDIKA